MTSPVDGEKSIRRVLARAGDVCHFAGAPCQPNAWWETYFPCRKGAVSGGTVLGQNRAWSQQVDVGICLAMAQRSGSQ